MNAHVSWRDAQPADVGLLLAFMQELYRQDHIAFDADAAQQATLELLAAPGLGRVWIIMDGDEAAGYVVLCFGYSLELHGRDAFIDELFVAAGHRGRGLGTATLAFVEAQSQAQGIRALLLEVDYANEAAHRLYRRVGFADHARFVLSKRLAAR